jgi:hypothetical protein
VVSAGVVSLSTIHIANGGTACTSLETYFTTTANKLGVNGLPYASLTINDNTIPYAKLTNPPIIPVLPTYTSPLGVSNGAVSLSTIPATLGGTGATSLDFQL